MIWSPGYERNWQMGFASITIMENEGRQVMSLGEVILEGTLHHDGTVELDTRPNLTPGRVQVVLRQSSQAPLTANDAWWRFMQATRKEMEEAGCRFLDDHTMQEHIDWLREEDCIDELLRQSNGQTH